MTRVELFELIRRDHYVAEHSIRQIAQERGVHRRTVRQALRQAVPPARKHPVREPPVLTRALRQVIDAWLQADRTAPRKQRHTGRRIYERLVQEHGYSGAAMTVQMYVSRRRRALGPAGEAFVPQAYAPGAEAQVDWYEAAVDFPTGRQVVQLFVMRACYSGREFHRAFPRQTQQAFLEGHVAAFAYFGGVFARIRYDNLGSAVQKVLRGRRREETDRFVALRSHYLFEADFCRPGLAGAHEKGGVEGAVGRFRRNHLVPVPQVANWTEVQRHVTAACEASDRRRITGHERTVAEDWEAERATLRPLPAAPLATAEVSTARVDSSARIRVRTNAYSVPVRLVGQRVEVRVHAQHLEVVHHGRVVATHERLLGRYGERLVLDHYLDLLQFKPGALPRARALTQARAQGQWPAVYDTLWAELQRRRGEAEGNRQLLAVLLLHRTYPAEQVHQAVTRALELGCCDAGAMAVLVRHHAASVQSLPELADLGALAAYGQSAPMPLPAYDALRSRPAGGGL